MASTPQLPATDVLSPMDNALMLSIHLEEDDGLPLLPLSPRINTISLPRLVHTSAPVMTVPSATSTPVIAVIKTDMVMATVSPSKPAKEVPAHSSPGTMPAVSRFDTAMRVFQLLLLPTILLLLVSPAMTPEASLSCTCDPATIFATRLFTASLLFGFIANEWRSCKSLWDGPIPVEPEKPSDNGHAVSGALQALFIGASVVLFLVGAVMLAFQAR